MRAGGGIIPAAIPTENNPMCSCGHRQSQHTVSGSQSCIVGTVDSLSYRHGQPCCPCSCFDAERPYAERPYSVSGGGEAVQACPRASECGMVLPDALRPAAVVAGEGASERYRVVVIGADGSREESDITPDEIVEMSQGENEYLSLYCGTLKPGEVHRSGGGASPIFEITRL